MPRTIAERFRGISGNQDERTIQYLVEGVTSDQEALNLTEKGAPLTYDLMPRQNIRVVEVDKKAFATRAIGGGETIEELDPTVDDGTYYTEAIYSRRRATQPTESTDEKPDPTDPDANHNTFSFEQSLETVHIRESTIAAPVRYIGTGGSPTVSPIKISGINVTEGGKVEGVDVLRPIGSFSYDYFPNKSNVDQTYLDLVTGLVGKVNSQTFFSKPAGTVLMTSASGRKRNTTDWEFNFQFAYRANVTSNTIGEGSNQHTYSANGWQYVWVLYATPEDPTDTEISIPLQVSVETIYETADLNSLFPP